MVTAIQTNQPRTRLVDPSVRIVLHGVPWKIYERLREEERNWNLRMTFDAGALELMSPSQMHEEIDNRFELFMVALAQSLRFEFLALVHTTWKNDAAEKAKEADACYYITNFERVRGKIINLEVDPPPDLAVEVEVSRSAIDSLRIYSALGVPEVWRFDGQDLVIHLRQADGSYLESGQSLALPFLTPEEVVFWMNQAAELRMNMEWMRQVQEWARVELTPRLENR